MAPRGCLPRCRPRESVHPRGRARHPPPPPRRPSRGPGFPSVARRCAREDHRGSGHPAGAGTRPGTESLAHPAERPQRQRDKECRRCRRATRRRVHACAPWRAARSARRPDPWESLCAWGRSAGSGTLPGGKARPGAGRGRRSRLPRPPKASAPLFPRHLPSPAGARQPAGCRPPSEGDERRGGCASGRGRAEHPSLPHTGGPHVPRRAGLGRTRVAPRRAPARGNAGDRRSAAPAAVARLKGRPPPRSPAGKDRRRTGAGGAAATATSAHHA